MRKYNLSYGTARRKYSCEISRLKQTREKIIGLLAASGEINYSDSRKRLKVGNTKFKKLKEAGRALLENGTVYWHLVLLSSLLDSTSSVYEIVKSIKQSCSYIYWLNRTLMKNIYRSIIRCICYFGFEIYAAWYEYLRNL